MSPENTDVTFESNIIDKLQEHDSHCELCESNMPLAVNSDITVQEVTNCIKNTKNGKSPGPDGIVNEMLKHSGENMHQGLCQLFNLI